MPASKQDLKRLRQAAFRGDKRMVRNTLMAGADPNHVGACGNSSLHYAALHGHYKIAGMLIDHGGDLTKPNSVGETPLQLASWLDPTIKKNAKLQYRLRPDFGNRQKYKEEIRRCEGLGWVEREREAECERQRAVTAPHMSRDEKRRYFKNQRHVRMRKHLKLGAESVTFPGPVTYYPKVQLDTNADKRNMLTPAQQKLLEKRKKQRSIISFQGKMTPNVRYPACATRGQTQPEDPGHCAIRSCVRPVGGEFDFTGKVSSYFCSGHGGGR